MIRHITKSHKTLFLFLGLILLVYLSGCVLASSMQNAAMFPVPQRSYDKTLTGLINLTDDEKPIYAVWLKNAEATYTILYCHGNGEDLGYNYPILNYLHKSGFSVLGFDYEGYGLSYGKPTEKGCYRSINAAYSFLREKQNIPARNIIVLGFSVGSGSATDLATREPIGALILQSPFLSAYRVVTGIKILPFDAFDNLAKIKKVNVPLLVIHGTHDNVIPFSHGKTLFEKANVFPQNKFISVDGAGHNNIPFIMGANYVNAIKSFASDATAVTLTKETTDEAIFKALRLNMQSFEPETTQGKDGKMTIYKRKISDDTATNDSKFSEEVTIVRSLVTGLKVAYSHNGKTERWEGRE